MSHNYLDLYRRAKANEDEAHDAVIRALGLLRDAKAILSLSRAARHDARLARKAVVDNAVGSVEDSDEVV